MFALQTIWFVLIAVLLAGYAVLDGFDLGVGFWYAFARGADERRAMRLAIAPVWDGNEVWLVTAGGALFAAFPPVYATVFSGFYPAMMGVLFALIFRGVAVEFCGQADSRWWRGAWGSAFSAGSVAAAALFGVAMGNVLRGLPLDAQGDFSGSFASLLNPYALGVGVLALAAVATHGALYVALKTRGALGDRARTWARRAAWVWAAAYAGVGAATIAAQPHLLRNYRAFPLLWALPAGVGGLIAAMIVACRRGRPARAFALSAAGVAGSMALAAAGLYPDLVPAANDAARSLTAFDASSSARTLAIMLAIALAGMPVVVAYQVWLHRTFRRPPADGEQGAIY